PPPPPFGPARPSPPRGGGGPTGGGTPGKPFLSHPCPRPGRTPRRTAPPRRLAPCRDRIPAYFSTAHHKTAAEYAEEAAYWQAQGWKGYKLHPPRSPWLHGAAPPGDFDSEACVAGREAVGEGMTLMLDSSWSYSYTEGLRVGQAIQDLGYHWFEDPFPTHDMHNY